MTTLLSIIIFFLGGRAQWSGAKGGGHEENRRQGACKGTEMDMVGYDDATPIIINPDSETSKSCWDLREPVYTGDVCLSSRLCF